MSAGEHEDGFSTRAIHVGQEPDPRTGAVTVPIYQTSTFAQDGLGHDRGYEYARTNNPTREALETAIASLEGGRRGIAYGSGMAAATSILHLLSAGDEVVAGADLYGGVYRLLETVFARFGVTTTYVDAGDLEAVERAFTPRTRMLWVETPTNPLLSVVDLRRLAELAHSCGVGLTVDNTFASPFLQNPLAFGADIVMHSSTKYIGGHSDLVGGLVVVNDDDLARRLHTDQNSVGGIPGPFDAWLQLRGMKTLAVRMERHVQNAERVSAFLAEHRGVDRVLYPGRPDHPQHELAARQMRGGGGMVSFWARPEGAEAALDAARRILAAVRLFTLAESLGGVESLIGHPATMTHAAVPKADREARGITDNLIRISVGIEDAADLIRDLDRALSTPSA
jgi:cystathionine gamma-lyase